MEQKLRDLEGQMAENHENPALLDELSREYTRLTDRFEQQGGYEWPSRIQGVLAGLGFSKERQAQPANLLSGGEKTRLCLARILLMQPDLLMLDEPTDHLDMESITSLNNALIKCPGVVLFACQDHQFIQTTANRIIELTATGMIDKQTTYDEYLASDELARKRMIMNMDRTDD